MLDFHDYVCLGASGGKECMVIMRIKTNVLIIIDGLWCRSGVSSVIMNYYRNLDYKNIQMDFLVFEDSKSDENLISEVIDKGSNIYYMPNLRPQNIIRFLKYINIFFSKNNQYKIVHSHLCFIDSLVFPLAKRHGVKYCISHSHNTKFSDYRVRAIRNKLMCLPITLVADYWFACSKEAGKALYGRKFEFSSKAKVINNAINCEKFNYNKKIRERKRKELSIENKKVIGYIGRLNPQKNVCFFLNVFKRILDKNNDYILLIIGIGPLKKELEQMASYFGIMKNVLFLGQRNDVQELMQAMDVLVLPSLYEGLPVVLVEAQIAGLPCVVSSKITREVGLSKSIKFIPIGKYDHKKWIESIDNLLAETRNSGLDQAQKKGYDIKIEAKKLSEFYRSLE